MDIMRDFIESVFEKNPNTCTYCLGLGFLKANEKATPYQCPHCKGTGKELEKE